MIKKPLLMLCMLICFSPLTEARHIIGSDKRLLHQSVISQFWKDKGNAVAGLVLDDKTIFKTNSGERVWNKLETLAEFAERFDHTNSYLACPNLRFKDELKPFDCSAFLISPQTIMTAGHCIDDKIPSSLLKNQQFPFVRNIPLKGKSELKVYFSQGEKPSHLDKVIEKKMYRGIVVLEAIKSNTLDYAIVKLDRPVSGIKPLEVDYKFIPKKQIPVRLIGHPQGLPLIHEPHGRIIYGGLSEFVFYTNLSAFGGNSGGPVLNENNGKAIGILTSANTRGKKEFIVTEDLCMGHYVVTNPDAGDTIVTRMDAIKKRGLQKP